MDRRERQLQHMFAEKALGPEERKRRKQAAKLRGGAEEAPAPDVELPRLAREDWEQYEELDTGPVRLRGRRARVQPLPAPGPLAGGGELEEAAGEPAEERLVGLVLSVAQGLAHVVIAGEERLCRVSGPVAVRQQSGLAVGDEVDVVTRSGVDILVAVHPRRSQIARRDPHDPLRERVIAANIDVVLVVEPAPLRLGLVDRLLLAVGTGGAQPVVVASKVDLLDAEGRANLASAIATYQTLGVPVVALSVRTGEGMVELRQVLAGQLAVLVGQSGVGKSSLLNHLAPELALATREVRDYDGKGRHATTASRLHDLGDGARVIDTPGVRQFGLWQCTAEDVLVWFPEIAERAAGCRFRDCNHGDEPGCAVVAALGAGVAPDRHAAFRRLSATLVGDADTA